MENNTPLLSKLTSVYLSKCFQNEDILYDEWQIVIDGVTHVINNKLVIKLILQSSPQEQRLVVDALQELKSSNMDINIFLKHLAVESNILSHIPSH